MKHYAGEEAPDDVTNHLIHETINNRSFSDEEIVSIVRMPANA